MKSLLYGFWLALVGALSALAFIKGTTPLYVIGAAICVALVFGYLSRDCHGGVIVIAIIATVMGYAVTTTLLRERPLSYPPLAGTGMVFTVIFFTIAWGLSKPRKT